MTKTVRGLSSALEAMGLGLGRGLLQSEQRGPEAFYKVSRFPCPVFGSRSRGQRAGPPGWEQQEMWERTQDQGALGM